MHGNLDQRSLSEQYGQKLQALIFGHILGKVGPSQNLVEFINGLYRDQ